MALSDWTQDVGATAISVSTTQSFEGSRSLEFGAAETDKVILLDDSIGSGAKEARITTQIYFTGDNNNNNSIGLALRYDPSTDEGIFFYIDSPGGTVIVAEGQPSAGSVQAASLYSNTNLNSWEEFRFTVYGDGNDLTAVLERRTSQNNDWTQAADSISWTTTKTNGGAVGLAGYDSSGGNTVYFDNTFVGWPNP